MVVAKSNAGMCEGRGYQKLGENVTKGHPDQHEAIDYFKEFEPSARPENPLVGPNQWPDSVSKFRPLVQDYLGVMIGLGRTIMQGIALALGGPRDLFEGDRAGDPFWILRVIGYPPVSNLNHVSDADGDEVGCHEHTDYGLLTFVNQDQNITALQVSSSFDSGVSSFWKPYHFAGLLSLCPCHNLRALIAIAT
ncbi:hypothetical protein M758_8G196100 [Ceratodon purpureus]|uniref:Uncharacterized protein n=1 Tax=Ceratodon purpureus TaxID=3225 RepID=A0A8T0H5J9_CERPU|nr:hypothetical protein KC19_8G201300 [Ceratodon purpureus]KAG0609601.1 hypothetical protein M758_8G196100 [Ceratodon purpureus]